MPVKKKKYARKSERKVPMVRFESEIFDDTFELPAVSSFDLKTQSALMKNDVDPLFEKLTAAKVDPEAIEAIYSLDREEVGTFMKEWGAAGEIPAPKSGA